MYAIYRYALPKFETGFSRREYVHAKDAAVRLRTRTPPSGRPQRGENAIIRAKPT